MKTKTLSATTATTWTVCGGCRSYLYTKRLDRNLKVCPECSHHHRLTAEERATQLFDPNSVRVLDLTARSNDVLGFVDTQAYPDRVEAARRKTGLEEGVLAVEATVDGVPVVAAIMDFRFLGGSLGAAAGELITQAGEEALLQRVPFLIVTASGGARMQEGTISLMQMAKTSQMIARLDEAGVMTVALITDPTFGGVSASFATQCDVIIAEPGARMGFAGRRVIEQTIGGPLPEGFQTAEFLYERGLVDMVRPRAQLRGTLRRLFAVMSPRQVPGIEPPAYGVLADDEIELPEIDPWHAVQQARRLDRPTTLDYIERVFCDFEELHGDRMGEESPAIVGGFAALAGRPVMVIGNQRGHNVAELSRRNYGMAPPSGYRKAMRLMRLAAKLGIPVVTFVDTPGAFPGVAAEERGQSFAIAESILLLSSLPVPVVTLIIGEGGSGGALALAVADKVFIGDGGVYSVISAEGCASILWNDATKAPDAARALKVDARSLLQMNIVDGVIREPEGGSHTDHDEAAERVAAVLHQTLSGLAQSGPAELVEARRTRFRSFGSVPERELIGGR